VIGLAVVWHFGGFTVLFCLNIIKRIKASFPNW